MNIIPSFSTLFESRILLTLSENSHETIFPEAGNNKGKNKSPLDYLLASHKKDSISVQIEYHGVYLSAPIVILLEFDLVCPFPARVLSF